MGDDTNPFEPSELRPVGSGPDDPLERVKEKSRDSRTWELVEIIDEELDKPAHDQERLNEAWAELRERLITAEL